MKVFGITGGVGAGKSEVLTYLGQNYDATVIQADEAGYLVMLPGGECYGEIVKLFGRQITTETGELDRKRIAEIDFSGRRKVKSPECDRSSGGKTVYQKSHCSRGKSRDGIRLCGGRTLNRRKI